MDNPLRVAILVERALAHTLFDEASYAYLQSIAQCNNLNDLPDKITREYMMEMLPGVQACITGWGTPALTDEMLTVLPDLRLIAHTAGSIRNLVPLSFWNGQRHITSNAPIIAEDVAQTTLAFALASLKQLWVLSDATRQRACRWKGGETYSLLTRRLDGLNVGLVGASLVGKRVAELFRPFRCRILMADPYLSPLEARQMGVELMPLDEMIPLSDVLSLHAPANADCVHLLNARNIPTIKDHALVINTARGILIDEEAFAKELRKQRFMACLDVTDPEPPRQDHPFRTLPNVILTPHTAGGHTANGRRMMGENTIKEIHNFFVKGLLDFDISKEMLSHMA